MNALTFSGSERDPSRINELLARATREAHLITPATACGAVLEGYSVAFQSIALDVDRETYAAVGDDDEDRGRDPGQKRVLGRSALDRIAIAAAIDWDPVASKRLDDGRDPFYCHYQAVGSYETFDRRRITLDDRKEVDLREGSAYVAQLREQAARRRDRSGRVRTADRQILNERVQILSYAISKARNRAVRRIGVRLWYTREELEHKPFVVARLMFTGASTDPELRRAFALMIAQDHMRARSALYGPAEPVAVAAAPHPPPAVAETPAEDLAPDLFCEYCGRLEHVTVRMTPEGEIRSCSESTCMELANNDANRSCPAPGASPPAQGAPAPVRPSRDGSDGGPGAFCIPGGDEKGRSLDRASLGSLRYWAERIDRNLCQGMREDFREQNERLLEALRAEIARRG